jgi:DNA-binding NarL/FixJ family response regulator
VRVVIAEDSVLLRAGLTTLLEASGIAVAAAVPDAETLLRSVAQDRPDLAIVDVRMAPTYRDEGVKAALVLRQQWPEIGVLLLSQYVEERYATELLSTSTSGVGYLLKDRVADVTEFLDALRRVAAGGTALDPEVVAQLLQRRQDPLFRLTARELDVLQLMAEGRSNQGVATSLNISPSAVEKHVNNIFTKLDLPPTEVDHRRVLAVLRYLDG